MIGMGKFLLGKQGSTPILHSHEKRVYLNMSWSSIGRAGEAANTVVNISEWNETYKVWVPDWAEQKTSERKLMPFVVDYDNLNSCVYHALCCYLFIRHLQPPPVDAEGKASPDYLFPSWAKLRYSGAADKSTLLIRSFVGKVPGIQKGHSATSIRISK
jgi:hypothetical protein